MTLLCEVTCHLRLDGSSITLAKGNAPNAGKKTLGSAGGDASNHSAFPPRLPIAPVLYTVNQS